ncbi:DUF992 domain-containing protein [uncultured Cohaesibacter sp.]|uniref:DUF992 domain-containing protein n=1 Tax=uncultured Cohaesibacter sp. TaxID=1002546 RepID=UPI0029C73287|nr:DUF992 domain-containing protein [uncultured Cohaesibacter sp.]
MKRAKKLLFAVAFPAMMIGSGALAQGVERIEVGRLDCAVRGGDGFIFNSTKDLSCTFHPANPDAPDEPYFGAISKWGLDVGESENGVISWLVLAPTKDDFRPGALSGDYAGVSAEATVGAGVGANVLLGGSDETIALQPLSVSAQTGLNFALAISQMELRSLAD